MKIVVVGAGTVGRRVAEHLSKEEHDIIVVDKDEDRRRRVAEQMDVLAMRGSGTSTKVLKDVGADDADIFLAVTDSDEVNIVSCLIASEFSVKTKVARVRNPEYFTGSSALSPQKLNIDLMINPEEEAAEEAVRLLKMSAATDIVEFEDGKIQLIGLKLDRNSPIVNRTLKDVGSSVPGLYFWVVAINRAERTIIPSADDYLRINDQVFVMAESESIEDVVKLTGERSHKLQRVMILGGSRVAKNAARLLADEELQVKMVESDRERSQSLADEMDKVLVLHGDGTDIDLLAREGILDMDGLVAATDDQETNILACLLAKHIGVKKVITIVTQPHYLPLMPSIGIDAAVDPNSSTVNTILRFVRRGRIVSVVGIKGMDAEVIELIANRDSKIVGKALIDVKFPKGATLGMLVKDGKVTSPRPDSVIEPDDRAVIFSLPSAISDVEKMFA